MRRLKAFPGLLREVDERNHHRFCSYCLSQWCLRCDKTIPGVRTESFHPHLLVLVRWKHRLGLPSLSAGETWWLELRVVCGIRGRTYMLRLELLFDSYFALMETTEFVDLVLVFPSDFDLVAGGLSLVFLRELPTILDILEYQETWIRTIRRFKVSAILYC